MIGEALEGLALSARELEQLTTELSRIARRVRGAGAELDGPSARACAEWASALQSDTVPLTELASDIRRTQCALDRYGALPAKLRERIELGAAVLDRGESPLSWLLRVLAALIDGDEELAQPWHPGEPSAWTPWSPSARPGAGPQLAGGEGERVGTDQGIRVAQLPDRP